LDNDDVTPVDYLLAIKFVVVNHKGFGATFSKLLRKNLGRFLILGKSLGKYLAKQ